AGVDHLDIATILELDVGWQRAHALDAVAFDDDGIVARRRFAGAVDQGAVAHHQGLLARGAHADLPPGSLRGRLAPNWPRCKQVFKLPSVPSATGRRADPA